MTLAPQAKVPPHTAKAHRAKPHNQKHLCRFGITKRLEIKASQDLPLVNNSSAAAMSLHKFFS